MPRYYLQIPGIPGDATDPAHRGWINLAGVFNPQDDAVPPSDRSKDARPASIKVARDVDRVSSELMQAAAKSTHFDSVVIESVTGSAIRRLTLESVYISEFSQSTSEPPTDWLTFSFERQKIENMPSPMDEPRRAADPTPGKHDAGVKPNAKPIYYRPVVRASAEATNIISTLVVRLGFRYTLKGETLSRIAYAADGQDSGLLDRTAALARQRVLPLRNVHVELREAGTDPDLDPPLAQVVSAADGSFEFVGILEEGLDYVLTAILLNTSQKLQQERVTITGIRVDSLPRDDSSASLIVRHRNHGVAGDPNHVVDETEAVRAFLDSPRAGESVLSLTDANALFFNTMLLDVPYINQNRNADNSLNSVNIDGIGAVSGGILCFPTSMAMAVRHFQSSGETAATTQTVATAAYRNWQARNFPNRAGTDGLARYQFTYGNPSGGNVWEWWLWENRAARQLVGLPLTANWPKYANDVDGLDGMPSAGQWQTHWEERDLLDPNRAQYLRRQMGRGWPIVVGTNLTSAGHIIIVRGIVIRNDGSIHKLIVNNPWGPTGPTEARALYYDSQTRGQTGGRLRLSNHFVLRRGVARAAVLDDLMVHGDGVGVSSTSVTTATLPFSGIDTHSL